MPFFPCAIPTHSSTPFNVHTQHRQQLQHNLAMAPAPPALLKWLTTGLASSTHAVEWADKEQTSVKVDGDLIKEPNAVARAVAKAVRPALVGVLPVDQAQVAQWQSWSVDATDVFAAAVELNTFLEGRSFLVGTAPTLADIQVYWALAPGVELTFPGPLGGLVALMRWFDFMQHSLRQGAGFDASLLPALVPLQSIYKPVAMPVFNKTKKGESAPAATNGGAAPPAAASTNGAPTKKGGDAAAPAAPAGSNNKGNKENQQQDGGKQQQKKKDDKATGGKPAPAAEAAAPAAAPAADNPNALDIRVGRMVKVWPHPEAEKLYCEEIDCGEEGGPRQIASGLRQFYADAAELEGRLVLVLANLKPRKLVGFASNGMVLCASNEEHTEVKLVEPPANAKVGDRVIFPGFPTEGLPLTPAQVQKKKVFETLAPGLMTDGKGGCMFKEGKHPFWVGEEGGEGGACTAPLVNAHVS